MEKPAVSRTRACALCAMTAALLYGCSTYPLDTSGRDLLELESVWQYLETYSIWQDSIPLAPDPFVFSSPEQLLASVNDTLHAVNYTTYDSTNLPMDGRLSAVAAGAPDTTVYWLPLTDSTAFLKITEFKKDTTYPAFLSTVPFLA